MVQAAGENARVGAPFQARRGEEAAAVCACVGGGEDGAGRRGGTQHLQQHLQRRAGKVNTGGMSGRRRQATGEQAGLASCGRRRAEWGEWRGGRPGASPGAVGVRVVGRGEDAGDDVGVEEAGR